MYKTVIFSISLNKYILKTGYVLVTVLYPVVTDIMKAFSCLPLAQISESTGAEILRKYLIKEIILVVLNVLNTILE